MRCVLRLVFAIRRAKVGQIGAGRAHESSENGTKHPATNNRQQLILLCRRGFNRLEWLVRAAEYSLYSWRAKTKSGDLLFLNFTRL